MPYTIKHYDKSNTNPGLIVNTKKVDNSTTLSFYGLNSSDFGSGLNENYLHLMEHFCNKDIPISKLVPGQLWFDSVLKKMKIWTGNKWHILKEYTTNVLPKGFVTIVGNIVNGATVSTANTLADEDGLGDFSYQWYLDSNPIANATEATYTIVLSDVGHNLAVSLSYIDGNRNKETVYSKQYPINSASNNLPTGSLTIDGLAIIGETVTAIVNNIQDADGFIGGNFGWLLDNVDITGENNPNYVIKPSDAGKTLKAKYYFTDLYNNNEVVYSSGVVIALLNTTTTTVAPLSTTTTLAPVVDTSALQTAISKCNATVPLLKDAWFSDETQRVTTGNKFLGVCVPANDQFDDVVKNADFNDGDALEAVLNSYIKWNSGIDACIKNKQDLFDIKQDESSAQALAAAYQEKLNVLKTNIEKCYAFRLTVASKYMSGTLSAKDQFEWYIGNFGLDGMLAVEEGLLRISNSSDTSTPGLYDRLSKWDACYTKALQTHQDILTKVKTANSVTRISNLCDIKISTYESFKNLDVAYYDAVHAKFITTVSGWQQNHIGSLDDDAIAYKTASTNKHATALTDKIDIVDAANTILNS